MKNNPHLLFACFLCLFGTTAGAAELPQYIQRVDIVHTTHTDIGYTDHPAVTREQQMRYLDIAIDAVLQTLDKPDTGKFVWEAEGPLAVDDWWQQATPQRKADLVKAIQSGQLEIGTVAMNQTATLDATQWKTMLHWLPEELDMIVPHQVGIQNDVNGFPRAGAVAMLDRGVENLWMGINATNGHAPFQVPAPFWWKMPDGRRLFVWLGESYPMGFYFFHDFDWRRGPVPESTDTHFRPARPTELFKTDEPSLRRSHEILCAKLRHYEAQGYQYSVMPLSLTNVWRMDNDPPFPAIAEFVAAWNKLGLQPSIYLSTASDAMERLKKEAGDAPEYSGEFTDWWVNGIMSSPREVAASRIAKRNLAAALSPVWGDPNESNVQKAADKILRQLCLFDEHTWGSVDSIGLPHAIDTHAQFNEKARTAYYGMALSKMLLAQRARTKIHAMKTQDSFYVVNTAPKEWRGWVYLKTSALREPVEWLTETWDPEAWFTTKMERLPGYAQFVPPSNAEEMTYESDNDTVSDNKPEQLAQFWAVVPPAGMLSLSPFQPDRGIVEVTNSFPAEVLCDEHGWPKSIHWKRGRLGFQSPLLTESPGDFVSVEFTQPQGRWQYHTILHANDPARRNAALKETHAEPADETTVERTNYSTVYTQTMKHPRLKWLTRSLEVYDKHENRGRSRATLTVRFYRISSELPEWFYIGCSFPSGDALPTASAGGMPFTPFTDQLPNTCMDYFAIDSWVNYRKPGGNEGERWTWISRDAPLVSFGGPQTLKFLKAAPENPNKVYAMVFDNTWMTNFACDQHGVFEFQFELVQGLPNDPKELAEYAETFLATPQLIIHPNVLEDPIFMERLFKP
ncbi:MAG: hypothetical protein FWH27_08430 [Planctomycetaceae bacterium]|nr:hypothetical protein [Planctomycetaceae bacterium]